MSVKIEEITVNCYHYPRLVDYVDEHGNLTNDSGDLREAVEIYISKYAITIDNNKLKILAIEISPVAWVWAVHKLHPVEYYEHITKSVEERSNPEYVNMLKEKLVLDCIHQKKFNERCNSEPYSHDDMNDMIEEYLLFLGLCKENPTKVIVPSFSADFIWHCHMQDNKFYRNNCMKIFGKILNHSDDFSDEQMKKFVEETKEIQKKAIKEKESWWKSFWRVFSGPGGGRDDNDSNEFSCGGWSD